MKLLAIDTTTEPGSCALWLDGDCAEHLCPSGPTSSETLLPAIRALLNVHGLRVDALDAIAFGAGPGAFTGLRVACGVTQGLAYPAGLPVVPVGSLAALAWQAFVGMTDQGGDDRVVLAMLDARMGEVYSAAYRRSGEDLVEVAAPRVARPEAVELPVGGDWRVAGNALVAYPVLRERIAAAGLVDVGLSVPRAAAVAHLGMRAMLAGQSVSACEALPIYVRDKVALTTAERLASGGRA